MTHTNPQTQIPAAGEAEQAFVQGLASYLKETTIYPDTNVRVRQKLAELVEASEELCQGSAGPVRMRVLAEGFKIGGSLIKRDSPMLEWLSERLTATAIGAVEFDGGVTSESFRCFAEKLKEVYPRRHRAATFEMMWPDPFDHLTPLPRRYSALGKADGDGDDDGNRDQGAAAGGIPRQAERRFDSVPEQDRRIAKLLESSETILAKAQRIESALSASLGPESEGRLLSLLGHIVFALPADVLDDPSLAARHVGDVLDAIESTIEEVESLELRSSELQLQSLMHRLTRSFFGSLTNTAEGRAARERAAEKAAAEEAKSEKPRLREEDEKIVADLDTFLREVAAMPDGSGLELNEAEIVVNEEHTGVLLHQLVHLDDEAAVVRESERLALRIPRMDGPELAALGAYLAEYLESDSEDAHRLRRVFALVERLGDLNLLRRSGALSHEFALRHFPRHFRMYVESMNPAVKQEKSSIRKLCAELGPRRIYEAAPTLADKQLGVLDPEHIGRLLIEPDASLIPLVHVGLELRIDAIKHPIAAFLKQMQFQSKEAQPLWVLDSPGALPAEFLSAVCKAQVTGKVPESLTAYAATIIREFIASNDGDNARAIARRCYAIQQLGRFPPELARQFLQKLLRSKGLLGIVTIPRQVRQAVKAALKSM